MDRPLLFYGGSIMSKKLHSVPFILGGGRYGAVAPQYPESYRVQGVSREWLAAIFKKRLETAGFAPCSQCGEWSNNDGDQCYNCSERA